LLREAAVVYQSIHRLSSKASSRRNCRAASGLSGDTLGYMKRMNQARDWISFWNAPHAIYVNARHLEVHYRLIAEHVATVIAAENADTARFGAETVALDYGCGEALHAAIVAQGLGQLILCDAAPRVRANLTQRFAANPKIEVRSPDEIEALAEGSVDFIIMVSVAQYLDPAQLDRLLAMFRRLVKSQGCVVIADIVPPAVSPVADALALLRLAWRNGFFVAALAGLVRTVFSDYRKLRATLGLQHYGEPDMTEKLARAGFAAHRSDANIGHNPARMTFIARPS
jgi:SAM-dependent methyltransferase